MPPACPISRVSQAPVVLTTTHIAIESTAATPAATAEGSHVSAAPDLDSALRLHGETML